MKGKTKKMEQPKYRITHPDQHNWCIEEWQDGGEKISRGRYAGQEKTAKWMDPSLFYGTLRQAALALLDKAAGDAMLTGEATSILHALELAEKRVEAALALGVLTYTKDKCEQSS